MRIISRGFQGRARDRSSVDRLPPGQHATADFPVLSAGPTPAIPVDEWRLAVLGEVDEPLMLRWDELLALPAEDITADIHCVTKWSKLDTAWRGVSVDTILRGARPTASHVVAFSYGGYTTNLPIGDVTGGRAWVAYQFDGRPLDPEHGGPARLLVPHLYFWKSAKWLRGFELRRADLPGFWEQYGYHNYGDPWREQRYRGD